MSNRRAFIKQSGAYALGSLALGPLSNLDFWGKSRYELGVQLFTLMAVIDQDTTGTLKKLADLGYKNHAKTAGLKYPFIEHDMPADAFDSLTRSKVYLKKNILK